MKTIEEMAHDYMCNLILKGFPLNEVDIMAERCFKLAEAMQAEAEKRKAKGDADPMRKVREAEWQPDWSQAPDEANTITIDACGVGQYWIMYHQAEPKLGDSRWFDDYKGRYLGGFEPLGFNGDWKDSLRKRP